MISSKRIAKSILNMESKGFDPDMVINFFTEYVHQKKILHMVPSILKYTERLFTSNVHAEIVKLRISTEISPERENDIKKLINAPLHTPVIKVLDKTIIGGFIAEYKNYIFDGSVLNQTKKLRDLLFQD